MTMRSTIKRTIAYILVLMLVLTMTPAFAFADEETEDVTAVRDLLFNGEMIADEGETADNDELFKQYVEKKLSEGIVNEDTGEIPGHARMRRVMPSGINAAIYASLKEQVKLVADGKEPLAVFEVTLDELALEKNGWTAEELGVPAIAVNGRITQEAKNALTKELGINMRSVLTALLFDCPYDLYWYDKERGVSISGPKISTAQGGSGLQIIVTSGITVSFEVADGYSTGNDNEVDPSKAERVEGAVNNAKDIVREAEGETDHGKLVSYKEAICSLVEYDQEAAADTSMPYGDPWQVISVFDEDVTSNVVCEGYSKAFQYLCDLTDFESDLDCISVSGTMSGGTGSGAHMWNILCMGDGKNYLADITNCDEGTVGSPDKLFIAGYAGGDVSSGYTFSCNGRTIKYYYDSETTSAFDDELIIAPKGSCPHDLIRSEEIPATCTVDGVREYWTCTMCEGLFGDANATEVLEQADIIITAGHKEEVMPAVAATCTEEGLTEGLRCSACGEILTAQEVVPAKGHVEEILTAREAACEEVGLTEGMKCSVCGEILEPQEEIPALGHNWGEWTVIRESTIAKEGTEQRVCKRDSSHTEEKAIPRKELNSVYRIYGDTRYETSLKVADDFKEKLGTDKFDTVIIACGTNYADALAGSYLSCILDAPILLTDARQDRLSALQAYIKMNLKDGGKIYMLGGTAVVPDSAVSGLSGYNTKRLWGKDRYETNIAILKEAAEYSSDSEILVCSGMNFPDSLSAAAAGKPILLVRGTLQDSQKNHLKSLNGPTFDIIGGTGAVSDSIKNELKAYGTTLRIEGSTRFETSVNVAKKFFDSPNAAVLAYGQTFPDGLCGGALAHAIGCPLILAGNGKTQFAEAYAHEKGIHYGAVLGGPTLISDESAESICGWGPVNQDTAVIRNISYELKGGENAPSNPAQYTEGIRLKLADPTYDNHSFCGWYLDPKCTQRVTEIDRDSKGDIILYAKWHLAALNISGQGLEDMIWSWWYYPQVISDDSGNVFWGYATKDGHCGVAEFDANTHQVTKNALKLAGADDHNGLALTLLDDGRIMTVYAGGHNTDNEIHVRISDALGNIRSFSTDMVLESAGKTCYSQIIRSSDKYYIFYRVNNSKWAYRYSADLAEWSEEVITVTAPMQYYCKFEPTTEDNIIRILMYSNPSGSASEIRLGFFDTTDNSVYDGSAITAGSVTPAISAKLDPSNNSYTSFMTLLEPPVDKTQRLFDCAVTDPGRTEFLYSVFSKKTGTNDSIYYLYDSGDSYEICAGGKPLMDYKYQLGASFVNSSVIVAARNVNDMDLVEQYAFDGNTVSLVKQLDSQTGTANVRNARPITDVNGRAVLWHNGYYNNTKYTDFDTTARLYVPDTDTLILSEDGSAK